LIKVFIYDTIKVITTIIIMTNLNIFAKITLYWYLLSGIAFMYLHQSFEWSLTASLSVLFVLTIIPTIAVVKKINHYYPFRNFILAYGVIITAMALAICKASGVI
jgi:hypothetical protein